MPASSLILVVDDDPHVVDLLVRVSQSLSVSLQFLLVSSFEQAVTYLEGLHGRGPRLVLLDLNLQSQLSGLDLLSRLRSHPQGRLVPVIVFSADGSQCRQVYDRGANAFTVKPESLAGWKAYVQWLQVYWFEVSALPKLWFDRSQDENNP